MEKKDKESKYIKKKKLDELLGEDFPIYYGSKEYRDWSDYYRIAKEKSEETCIPVIISEQVKTEEKLEDTESKQKKSFTDNIPNFRNVSHPANWVSFWKNYPSSYTEEKDYDNYQDYRSSKNKNDSEIDSLINKIDDLKNEINSYFNTVNRLKRDNLNLKQKFQALSDEESILRKENKRLTEMLELLENNPEEYKKRKDIDPFNEEKWDD